MKTITSITSTKINLSGTKIEIFTYWGTDFTDLFNLSLEYMFKIQLSTIKTSNLF